MKKGGNFFLSFSGGNKKGGQLTFYSIFSGVKGMLAAKGLTEKWWNSAVWWKKIMPEKNQEGGKSRHSFAK